MSATGTRLCADSRRALVASVGGLLIAAVVGVAVAILADPPDLVDTGVVLALIGWNVFAVAYLVLTVRVFWNRPKDEFETLMAVRGESRPALWRLVNRRGDGPTFALEASLVAFIAVLVLPNIDALDVNDWILIPLCLSILLSCWGLSIISYALHYAQKDLAEPAFEWPGSRTDAFDDYVYFSIAVATTFGATDVNITRPSMRRVVNLHTILTFLYNSVIVALLAALLIS